MPGNLPRASGTDPVAIQPDAWNAVMDAIERGMGLRVSAPLEFIDHPGGKLLRIKPGRAGTIAVKLTSAATGSGEYNARDLSGVCNADPSTNLAMPEGLTVASTDNLLAINLAEDASQTAAPTHWCNLPTWTVGTILPGLTSESTPRRIVAVYVPPAGVLFRVSLAQNGGADGAVPSTPATWTYDVTTLSGVAVGTAVAVEKARLFNAPMAKATRGVAYYNAAGTLVLWDVDEHYTTGLCT